MNVHHYRQRLFLVATIDQDNGKIDFNSEAPVVFDNMNDAVSYLSDEEQMGECEGVIFEMTPVMKRRRKVKFSLDS